MARRGTAWQGGAGRGRAWQGGAWQGKAGQGGAWHGRARRGGAWEGPMARMYLKRSLSGFTPADEPSQDDMRKFKVGEIYRADIVKPRNYKHHCLIMSLLTLTYENQERYKNFTDFRKAVAYAAGHIIEYPSIDGEIIREADSLSYDRLDEIEFTKVAGAMMTVCAHLLGDMGIPELEAEVSKYCDEHYGATT